MAANSTTTLCSTSRTDRDMDEGVDYLYVHIY